MTVAAHLPRATAGAGACPVGMADRSGATPAGANMISSQAALDLKTALEAEAEPGWIAIRTTLKDRGGFLVVEIELAALPAPGLTPGRAAARSVLESWLPGDLGGSPQWAVVFSFEGRAVDSIVPGEA